MIFLLLKWLVSWRLDYLIWQTAGWSNLKNYPNNEMKEMNLLAALEQYYRNKV